MATGKIAARPSQAVSADPLAGPLAALATAGDANSIAQRERLAQLRRATQGLWQPSAVLPSEAGEPVLDADGRVLGRLWLHDGHLTWQATGGPAWRALLATPPPR